MRILGIDPGTKIVGLGIIEVKDGKISYVHHSSLDLRREKDSRKKLVQVFRKVSEIVTQYRIDEISLEKAYSGKDYHASELLNQVRGIILLIGGLKNIPVFEYPPAKVKRIVTGNGRAEKFEVARIVEYTLSQKLDGTHDSTDALALALCRYYVSKE